MATQKKTADVDYSMQEKILALYELQKIDSKIDEINKVKGELPLEVQDLEDEMAGMTTRIEHVNAEIEELNTLTKQRKREVDQAKIMIGNYKEQQNNVRNNREFDAISKEIEYQELEIELAEKRLKEYAAGIKGKKLQLEEAENLSKERAADLAAKKAELDGIEAETAPQVAEYEAQLEAAKAETGTPVTLSDILRYVWYGGMAAMALWFLGTNLVFRARLRKGRERLEYDFALPVYVTDAVETPCLFGRTIYVTREAAADALTLRHSVEHELTHHRHGDHGPRRTPASSEEIGAAPVLPRRQQAQGDHRGEINSYRGCYDRKIHIAAKILKRQLQLPQRKNLPQQTKEPKSLPETDGRQACVPEAGLEPARL